MFAFKWSMSFSFMTTKKEIVSLHNKPPSLVTSTDKREIFLQLRNWFLHSKKWSQRQTRLKRLLIWTKTLSQPNWSIKVPLSEKCFLETTKRKKSDYIYSWMLATVGSSFRLKHFVRTDEKNLHVYLHNSCLLLILVFQVGHWTRLVQWYDKNHSFSFDWALKQPSICSLHV